MFPSFLVKMFRIRQRSSQTTAGDATLMAKALHVLPTF